MTHLSLNDALSLLCLKPSLNAVEMTHLRLNDALDIPFKVKATRSLNDGH